MKLRLPIAFLLVFLARTCAAFEIFPEYQSLTESEATSLDSTALIDSEYQSDVNTYRWPLEWDPEFFSRSNAANFTLGSLSNVFFLQNDRVRWQRNLLPTLKFSFIYFQERDLTSDQTHVIAELAQKLTESLRVAIYGEPSHFKRENTAGLALIYLPTPHDEIRLFHSWMHFTRSEHNDRRDYFVEGSEPTTFGFVLRHTAWYAKEMSLRWLEVFARRESPTQWRFPQSQSDYTYDAFSTGASAIWEFGGERKDRLNIRLRAGRKFEGFQPLTPASTVTAATLERRNIEGQISYEFMNLDLFTSKNQIEAGVGWHERRWLSDTGDALDQRNLAPILWWRFPGPARGEGHDQIALGYDGTVFSADGAAPLASLELKTWTVEHRANFRYTFSFIDAGELGFLLSADLDAAFRGSGGLFEGGQGHLKAFF